MAQPQCEELFFFYLKQVGSLGASTNETLSGMEKETLCWDGC